MNEIQHYTDANGNRISIQKEEIDSLPGYLIETYSENDIIIHEKTYKNGLLKNISFYAYSEEEITSIVIKNNGNVSIVYQYHQNSYTISETLTYCDHTLILKMATVKDCDNNIICFKKYEPKNDVLTCTITDKSYYQDGINIYDFEYNPDGSCFIITSVQTYQEDIFAWDIGTDNTDFTWNGLEYYQNAEPLVPESYS